MFSRALRYFKAYPAIGNALVYGSLYVTAEFSQQTLLRKVLVPPEKKKPYDTGAIARYSILGYGVFPHILYRWYKVLDKVLIGTAPKVVFKKVLLDQFLVSPPLLFIFYVGMSVMERRPDIFEELKEKFYNTFQTSCLFWLPVQTVNFLLIPPAARVVYVGMCSFIWVNILCWLKRQDYEPKAKNR